MNIPKKYPKKLQFAAYVQFVLVSQGTTNPRIVYKIYRTGQSKKKFSLKVILLS